MFFTLRLNDGIIMRDFYLVISEIRSLLAKTLINCVDRNKFLRVLSVYDRIFS